jgi:hypothetical protein
MFDWCYNAGPADLHDAWQEGDATRFDEIFYQPGQPTAPTNRWRFHDQGLLSFQEKAGFAGFKRLQKFALDTDAVARISMPAFIGDAEPELFFTGQPKKVDDAIGANANLYEYTDKDAAATHCGCGALTFQN